MEEYYFRFSFRSADHNGPFYYSPSNSRAREKLIVYPALFRFSPERDEIMESNRAFMDSAKSWPDKYQFLTSRAV